MMVTLVIQAGGKSSRMGLNKALLPFQGEPLILRVYHRLASIVNEVLVTVNQKADFESLGLPLVPDLLPGKGTLGGFYTGLQAARNPLVAVVGCDMPFVSPILLHAELDLLTRTDVDAVIPFSENGLEPLHAVYRRQTCLPAIYKSLVAERLRLISWLPDVKVQEMTLDEVKRHDPNLFAFFNVNTPDELKRAESMAAMEKGQSNNLSA
jgi:molybdopterin-guanine dinucleotide biosynthesis protein A